LFISAESNNRQAAHSHCEAMSIGRLFLLKITAAKFCFGSFIVLQVFALAYWPTVGLIILGWRLTFFFLACSCRPGLAHGEG